MLPTSVCSGSNLGDVCVGQIFNIKKKLRDKFDLMALKNHFQFRVYKSTTNWFKTKCIVEWCKWQVRATKKNSYTYFLVSYMSSMHTCQNEELQDRYQQTST